MLSMSKLLVSIALVSSLFSFSACAKAISPNQKTEVLSFLKHKISQNPNVSDLHVRIVGSKVLKQPKGWTAYTVAFSAKAKMGKEEKKVTQRSTYFVKDGIITTILIDMKTGQKLNDMISPKFKNSYYSKSNLLYGDADAKYKVAIFSDPLCPFCKEFVPPALKYMKKYPKDFAVYYYNFPLSAIHPASPTVVRAALYKELQGDKSIILRLYGLRIPTSQTDEKKILAEFNRQLGTYVTLKDIHSVMVNEALKHDQGIADKLMVRGTPTFFFDGELDPTKSKYKEVKVQ